MKIENVLSLFDGMSCGRLALERAGIEVGKYYASEVDKYAITVTKANWPETIHLGDVRNVAANNLPVIDLLIGGSPCQSFSFAGKRAGMVTKEKEKILTLEQYLELKAQGFEFEGQSYLFWEYVRILREVKPRYFLLENVLMKKEWKQVISETLGVKPIMINSALVSAQNRKRLYWTNIPGIMQPQDKGILLKDIIEDGECDREKSLVVTTRVAGATAHRYLTKSLHQMIKVCNTNAANEGIVDRDKSLCLDANYAKGGNPKQYFEKHRPQLVFGAAQRGRYNEDGTTSQLLEINGTYKANTITTVQKDSLCGEVIDDKIYWRKLTALECERLQTVPDNYTAHVSNSQRYRMLGNGWTVDVIAHIMGFIFNSTADEFIPIGGQHRLF